MKRLLASLALALAPILSFATNHYINPNYTGVTSNGNDWTTPLKDLPPSLVRGDVYFLAGGNYQMHTFDDPPLGTTPIIVKHAMPNDHGTSVGWSNSFSQTASVFPSIAVFSSYYSIDGQHRDVDWWKGSTSAYGIKVDNSNLNQQQALRMTPGTNCQGCQGNRGASHVFFKFIDFRGGGRDTRAQDDIVYGNLYPVNNIQFTNVAMHDTAATIFRIFAGWHDITLDHSYFARNTSTSQLHGEFMSIAGNAYNLSIAYSVFEDIEGTAIVASVNGPSSGYDENYNWNLTGNVVYYTDNYINGVGRKAYPGDPITYGISGIVFVGNSPGQHQACLHDSNFMQNSFIRIQGLWSGIVYQSTCTDADHPNRDYSNLVFNNLWYDSARTNNTPSSGSKTLGYNWYYKTIAQGGYRPDNDSVNPSEPDYNYSIACYVNCSAIFVNFPEYDFHLMLHVLSGQALTNPFGKDMDSNLRLTWDRGAYEYVPPPGRRNHK